MHIAQGFEFLGIKIQRGKGQFKLTRDRVKSTLNRRNLYAILTQKTVDRFKDQIRTRTKRHSATIRAASMEIIECSDSTRSPFQTGADGCR